MVDEMRMMTACVARAPQRCTSHLSKHFLLTFQEVTPLSKTRNQLMVYINTLMIQQVLTDETWWARMTPDDLRALTPLIYAHVTPYGTFKLDMQERIPLEAA